MTIEEINKYVERTKLPEARKHYGMTCGTMRAIIDDAAATARKSGFFDAIFDTASLAFKYGMAAGYRLGRK